MLAVLMFLFITGMQAQTVTPSKKYITKELNNVSNFSSIKVLGSTDVEYRQSSGSKTEIDFYIWFGQFGRFAGSIYCEWSVAGEYQEGG